MAKLEADFIVGVLYDFFCEDLLVHDELAGQIDASMDTFTSEVGWLRFFFFVPCRLFDFQLASQLATDLLGVLQLSDQCMYRCREESEAISASLVVMIMESANLTVRVPMQQFFIVSVSFCIKRNCSKYGCIINYSVIVSHILTWELKKVPVASYLYLGNWLQLCPEKPTSSMLYHLCFGQQKQTSMLQVAQYCQLFCAYVFCRTNTQHTE